MLGTEVKGRAANPADDLRHMNELPDLDNCWKTRECKMTDNNDDTLLVDLQKTIGSDAVRKGNKRHNFRDPERTVYRTLTNPPGSAQPIDIARDSDNWRNGHKQPSKRFMRMVLRPFRFLSMMLNKKFHRHLAQKERPAKMMYRNSLSSSVVGRK